MSQPAAQRVVIVGADGRLGRPLVELLRARHHEVIPLGRAGLDLAVPASIDAALGPLEYDELVLTAALTAVDHCESHPQEAHAVNAEGPAGIAAISAAKGARVTYLSTDFVFDGASERPYSEDEIPSPLSVYGASKLAGEQAVLTASPANLVARVSWVFGPHRPAFPEWVIGQARQHPHFTLPCDKTASPTYTLDLVEWLAALLFDEHPSGPASGIYHLCNSGICSWRDWGMFCVDAARVAGASPPDVEIEGVPVDSVAAFVARRPRHSALDTTKFTTRTGIRPRPWQQAVTAHIQSSVALRS